MKGVGRYRVKGHFHHLVSRLHNVSVFITDINLGHPAKVVFVGFLNCRVSLALTFPSILYSLRGNPYKQTMLKE